MEVKTNIESGFDKRCVVKDKCRKGVQRPTTRAKPVCAQTEKEISVDEKSVVESYKLKEASIRLTLQCFLPRLECSQGDLSANHSSLNPSELMGAIFPFPRRGWIW